MVAQLLQTLRLNDATTTKSQFSQVRMKGIFVVALATMMVAFVAAQLPVNCPDTNGEDVVLLPNPVDCTTYYSCDNGIPYLMQCNDGLHFNAEERVCDWPEHARCEPLSTPLPSTTSADNEEEESSEELYV